MDSRTPGAAVAAASSHTADAAIRIAESGGNVVDMAVAAALVGTVSETLMASLGGSAFLMMRLPGQAPLLIDGSDIMPRIGAPPDAGSSAWKRVNLPYGDGIEVVTGHASVAVPGMLCALELAARRHGLLPWRELVAPAIEAARTPCPTGGTVARWLEIAGRAVFFEQEASRACFFPDGENPLEEGEGFTIPHMAETLELIAEEGARALYEGDLSIAFEREMIQHGGYVTREDLAKAVALEREPIRIPSAGFELALNPPPAIGGAAVGAVIGMIEAGWSESATEAEHALLLARVQRELLRLREGELAKPEFSEADAHGLLASASLRKRLAALQSPNTTHFSVASVDGGLVGVTMSNGYGSGITIPGTGIICNNSLGEPELNPWGFHAAKPGSRLVSNMAPTIASAPDGRCLVMGSPGASRITTAIAQTWAHYAFGGRDFEDAVIAPRLHVEEWHDGCRAQCEPGIDTSLLYEDFVVRPFEERDMFFGAVKLAGLDAGGQLHAVADDRRQGTVRFTSW